MTRRCSVCKWCLLAEPMRSYAAKVRDESYRVTDADVAKLRAVGVSEDEIFEVTVAAAVGAAWMPGCARSARRVTHEVVDPGTRAQAAGKAVHASRTGRSLSVVRHAKISTDCMTTVP